jgi:Dna[CI] antecedent DciA-like protein
MPAARSSSARRGDADARINRTAQCYPRGVIPVQQVIPGALEAVLRRTPLTREKVAFAWRVAVGPAVDRATMIDLRDNVLYVSAKDPAWHREIERSIPLIRKRLASLLGEHAVRRIQLPLHE